MKKQYVLFLALSTLLGCETSHVHTEYCGVVCMTEEKYTALHELHVIHDLVEDDYWNGRGWVQDRTKALKLPLCDAWPKLLEMRAREAGGYADSGTETDRPIVLEKAGEEMNGRAQNN